MDEKLKRAEFTRIMAALRLTDAELAANRQGTFTAANAKRLELEIDDNASLFGCGIFGIVLFGCITVAMLTSPRTEHASLLFLSALSFMVLLQIHVVRRDRKLNLDRDERGVAATTGELQTSHISGRGAPKYFAAVAGVQGTVSHDAYLLLKTREGEAFTVYFTVHSKLLLALEPARKPKDHDDDEY